MPVTRQILDTAQIAQKTHTGLNPKTAASDGRNISFFSFPLLSQRLSTLKNMVGGRSQLIVLTGESGSGKTTLMKEFMARSDSPWQRGRIRLKPHHRYASKLWGRLNHRRIFVSKCHGQPSMIIDDAHQLSPQALKTLLQWAFCSGRAPRLQSIFLLADTQMQKRYNEMAAYLPAHSVIDKIHMTALTEEQTAAYLRHRMKVAGCSEGRPFSDKEIRAIHRTSWGWPGSINREAAKHLKSMSAPRNGSTSKTRTWPFRGIETGVTKWFGFQHIKSALKMDPTPWVP